MVKLSSANPLSACITPFGFEYWTQYYRTVYCLLEYRHGCIAYPRHWDPGNNTSPTINSASIIDTTKYCTTYDLNTTPNFFQNFQKNLGTEFLEMNFYFPLIDDQSTMTDARDATYLP